ncbi:MCE family protein MceF [Nocardia nova SH22a]|uniref:MCE family protein MceF n=1 Tax=Nocardia nova SH22a TaxID=1415166 RepID=W5T8D4_9NOCA|nr:MlaD family protein [Nocardia nova]AHH15374.1 MCE family protein MceF [Nocardia nova SH22a]
MKLSKFVRTQLVIFAIVAVVSLVVMSASYLHLPAMFGIGRYQVTVQLEATGGLYPTANVTYRGTNIGKVQDVKLTPDGVDARMSISSKYKVPADVDAYVKSVSAIGEQYVDLVPVENPHGGNLRDGSVIPVQRTRLPQDVGDMLDQADRLLSSVADTKLREVIDDAFIAFNGAGPDLQRFIDSASLLVQEAKGSTEQTKDLLAKLGPLLDTQNRSDPDIRAWTKNLATVTDQLREHDPSLRDLIQRTPSAAQKVSSTFQDLKPTLPILLSNLVSVGQVGVTYHAGVEQILVVLPPMIAALMTAAKSSPTKYGAKADFMLGLNDPPGCTTGFLPPDQRRSPTDFSIPDTPELYCKISQDSSTAVRGIRNFPCAEVPGKRAPTPELCRDPRGYVPEGTNPAFGPPQPVPSAGEPPAQGTQTHPASFSNRSLDPSTGTFTGPDGRTYRQGDIGADGSGTVPSSWQSMLEQQQR